MDFILNNAISDLFKQIKKYKKNITYRKSSSNKIQLYSYPPHLYIKHGLYNVYISEISSVKLQPYILKQLYDLLLMGYYI